MNGSIGIILQKLLTKMGEKLKIYLRDIIYVLKEHDYKLNLKQELTEFEEGSRFTNYKILELLRNHAHSSEIDLNTIGFYDFEEFIKKNHEGGDKKQ